MTGQMEMKAHEGKNATSRLNVAMSEILERTPVSRVQAKTFRARSWRIARLSLSSGRVLFQSDFLALKFPGVF